MLTYIVSVSVHAESVEAFIAATADNSLASMQEPGVARFDVLQDDTDPTRFMLIEVYRTNEAPAEHKATAHYATWRDTVAPMMASPRQGTRFRLITSGE